MSASVADVLGAIAKHRERVAVNPRSVDAHYGLGTLLESIDSRAEAIECFRRVVALKPRHLRALNSLGVLLRKSGRIDESLEVLRTAQKLFSHNAETLTQLGLTLNELGRPDQALAQLRRALALEPRLALAHFGVGQASMLRRDLGTALSHLSRALSLQPDLVEAYFVWAAALRENGQHADSIGSLLRAVQLKPRSADAHYHLGVALAAAGQLSAAVESFEDAIRIDPSHSSALRSKGWTLVSLKQRVPEAIASLEKALELKPRDQRALWQLFHGYGLVCDWHAARATLQRLREHPDGVAGANPYIVLTETDDPAEHLCAARAYAEDVAAIRPPLEPAPVYAHDKIRVAYLSSDFRTHPTSHLMAELFELHERNEFEVIGVSLGPRDDSDVRRRIESACNVFLDGATKSEQQVALWLRKEEVDIAVDLNGYTGYLSGGILAYRPAPVQVNYLAYPGTLGAPYIDYLIADSFVIPEPERQYYSERIIYLPDSYQVNDRRRAAADWTPSRQELGLPESGLVFCCFNNNWKITESVFDVWMRLLAAVEGSVLWLLQDSPWAVARLREEAAKRGIVPERLVFAARMPTDRHLARQRVADLFLDTLPCNAHTTASDALWMGLPLVTCSGRGFPSRVAGSLLRAVGLEELVTTTLEDYERLVLELARDPERRRSIRKRLAEDRARFPLFDSPAFCRHLETAYRRMWLTHREGRVPEDFTVERLG